MHFNKANNISLYCTCLILVIKLNAGLHAQIDTSIVLAPVDIKANNIRESTLENADYTWSENQLSNAGFTSVSDLLMEESDVYIKSYGVGSIATTSIQGASAQQTVLLWNGMPIKNPMLGLMDLSLLSLNGSSELSIKKGSNSSMWGSGAIGGVITLNQSPHIENNYKISTQSKLASFGAYQHNIDLGLALGNLKIESDYQYNKAENDFSYSIDNLSEKFRQTHAATESHSFNQSINWQSSKNSSIDFQYWHSQFDREIPPTLNQTKSEAYQHDAADRFFLSFENQSERIYFQAKVASIFEKLDYYDPSILLESLSEFKSYIAEIGSQYALKPSTKLYIGMSNLYTSAVIDAYDEDKIENQFSLFSKIDYQSAILSSSISMNYSTIDGKHAQLLPQLDMRYKVLPLLSLDFSIGRTYRYPSLNDRYWRPGGNEDLMAESGWSQALHLNLKTKSEVFEIRLGAFNRRINNWILWTLEPGRNYFSASNLAQVWSRGIESGININKTWKQAVLKNEFNYSYIRSTNEKAIAIPVINPGDQLIYTPKHNLHFKSKLMVKNFAIKFNMQYHGKVLGINGNIDAYSVSCISANYKWPNKVLDTHVFVGIKNIFDHDYQIIEQRPMPGRNFELGIKFSKND